MFLIDSSGQHVWAESLFGKPENIPTESLHSEKGSSETLRMGVCLTKYNKYRVRNKSRYRRGYDRSVVKIGRTELIRISSVCRFYYMPTSFAREAFFLTNNFTMQKFKKGLGHLPIPTVPSAVLR
jgi:hypothetical protein